MSRSTGLIGAIAASLAFSVIAATALADPSFDCDAASAPIEYTICNDPELARLDIEIADAYEAARTDLDEAGGAALLAEQRSWLQERLTRCDIPASGAAPTLEQQWRWAPCLYEVFLDRTIAFGLADLVEPHPACLEHIAGVTADGAAPVEPLPMRACNRGHRHVPVDIRPDGERAASGRYDMWPSYFSSIILDDLDDGSELRRVYHWTGGTGQFSYLITLKRTLDRQEKEIWLTARSLGAGGDRCNGGIATASLLDPATVLVTNNLTPFGLVAAGLDPVAATADNPVLAALPDCAVCCVGTRASRLDIATGALTMVSATVDPDSDDVAELLGDDPATACLADRIRRRGEGAIILDVEDLRTLAAEVLALCKAP